jgi:hypothetical protein
MLESQLISNQSRTRKELWTRPVESIFSEDEFVRECLIQTCKMRSRKDTAGRKVQAANWKRKTGNLPSASSHSNSLIRWHDSPFASTSLPKEIHGFLRIRIAVSKCGFSFHSAKSFFILLTICKIMLDLRNAHHFLGSLSFHSSKSFVHSALLNVIVIERKFQTEMPLFAFLGDI